MRVIGRLGGRIQPLLLLALVASGLAAQEQDSSRTQKMFFRVRFVDSTHQGSMQARWHGQLLRDLGVAKGETGTVSLGPTGGRGTGILTGELAAGTGEVVFSTELWGPQLELTVFPASSAATPRLYARGRNVRVVRDDSGQLSIRASW
jgi:hypothetical protein